MLDSKGKSEKNVFCKLDQEKLPVMNILLTLQTKFSKYHASGIFLQHSDIFHQLTYS